MKNVTKLLTVFASIGCAVGVGAFAINGSFIQTKADEPTPLDQYTPWTSTDSLPSESGDYALQGNVTLSSTWEVPSRVNLYLNDYIITSTGTGPIINANDVLLNIFGNENAYRFGADPVTVHKGYFDSNDGLWHLGEKPEGDRYTLQEIEGALICGGKNASGNGGAIKVSGDSKVTIKKISFAGNTAKYGGAICVEQSEDVYFDDFTYVCGNVAEFGGAMAVMDNFEANLTVNGPLVENNVANDGGAFYCATDGNLNLYGGLVCENVAKTNGKAGGVSVNGLGVKLGGSIQIKDNVSGSDKKVCNVKLASGAYLSINSQDEKPSKDFEVGVTCADVPTEDTPVKVTSSFDASLSSLVNINNDEDNYPIRTTISGSEAYLELKKPMTVTNNAPSSKKGELNGYIDVTDEACIGDLITIHLHPNRGYVINTLSYNDGIEDFLIETDGFNPCSFVMPGRPVTVKATFREQKEALSIQAALDKAEEKFPTNFDSGWRGPNGFRALISNGYLCFRDDPEKLGNRIDLSAVAVDFGKYYEWTSERSEYSKSCAYARFFFENNILTKITYHFYTDDYESNGTYLPYANARKTIAQLVETFPEFPVTNDETIIPLNAWKTEKGYTCVRYKNDALGKDELIFSNGTDSYRLPCDTKADYHSYCYVYKDLGNELGFVLEGGQLSTILYNVNEALGGIYTPHEHTYGQVTATWNDNMCTLKTSCACGHEETLTAEGTYVKISDATTTAKEKGKYVLVVEDGVFKGRYESPIFEKGEPLPIESEGLSGGAIAGIVLGSVACAGFFAMLGVILVKRKRH